MWENQQSVYNLFEGFVNNKLRSDNSHSEFGFRFVFITWETERVPRNVWWCIVRKIEPLWKDKDIKWKKHIFGKGKGEVFKRIIKIEILEWDS